PCCLTLDAARAATVKFRDRIGFAIKSVSRSNWFRDQIGFAIESVSRSNCFRDQTGFAIEQVSRSNRFRDQTSFARAVLRAVSFWCHDALYHFVSCFVSVGGNAPGDVR
ncbi:unnamed protein product, partial [Laminaria digitata]